MTIRRSITSLQRHLALWYCLAMAAVAVAMPEVLHAQSLRGRITVVTTNTPLVGALVELNKAGAAGNVEAVTTTTDARGVYVFDRLAAGTYTVRVLRIGYRPFVAGSVNAAEPRSVALDIVWAGVAVPLAARVVSTARTCRISAEQGTQIAEVWIEARKALLSSSIAERGEAPLMQRLNYQRTLNAGGEILRENLTPLTSRSFRAYESWTPDSLAQRGYAFTDSLGTTYLGPDAATLISESFAGTHCFSLVRGAGNHEGEIGLGFAPSAVRPPRVDISGTFWIARNSWNLKSVEFRFVGLPASEAGIPVGGEVEFGDLQSGQWFVKRWRITAPRRARVDPLPLEGRLAGLRATTEREVTLLEESGGVVTRVADGDSTVYQRNLPSLEYRVIQRDSGIRVAGTEIRLVGTEHMAVADESGVVKFPHLLNGLYIVRPSLPRMSKFGAIFADERVLVLDANARDSTFAPTSQSVITQACGTQAANRKLGVVYGTLRDTVLGNPHGVVTVIWQDTALARTPNGGSEPMVKDEHWLGALVSAGDQFLICEVPTRQVVVRGETFSGMDERHVAITAGNRIVEVSLAPGAHPEPGRPQTTATLGLLDMLVVDSGGAPRASVVVEFRNVRGKVVRVTTNGAGRALLLEQPVGNGMLQVLAAPARQSLQGVKLPASAASAPLTVSLLAGFNYITLTVPDG